jgi:predicted DNA-binding protein
MEEKTRKINVTTMLEPEIFQKLAAISRQTGKSISALIREAVKEWLKNQ